MRHDTRTPPKDTRRAEDDPRLPAKPPTRKMTLVIEEPIAQAIVAAAQANRRSQSHQVNFWLSQAVDLTGL